MDFKGVLANAKEFVKLTGFLNKMGEKFLFKLKEDRLRIIAFTSGTVSTSVWVKVEPEAIFSEFMLDRPINLLVQARDFHQMIHAMSQCTYIAVELVNDSEQPILRFSAQSEMAAEVGELNVDIVQDRQIRDIKEPGSVIPDICLTLPPLNSFVNFVKAYSRQIDSLQISANANGHLTLAVRGPHISGELTTVELTKPNLNIEIPEQEDRNAMLSVNIRIKQFNKFLGCRILSITNGFFSLIDTKQITFFIFLNLGSGANSSLTVHFPLFIE